MQFHQEKSATIKGISITRPYERTFFLIVSMDIHTVEKNAYTDACAHIYKDALISGCKGYTREAFLDAVNLLGGEICVSVSNDILTISVKALDTHAEEMMRLFTVMMQKPTFATLEMKRIKVSEENSLIQDKENAKTQSLSALVNTLYGEKDRRYIVPEDELIASFKSITKSDLQKLHSRVLSSFWTYTLTAHPTLEKKIRRQLEKLKSAYPLIQLFENTVDTKKVERNVVVLQSIPSRQNIELNIAGILPLTERDDEYFAFLFGLSVLGKWGGFAGRLMSTVREKEGLTYGIYAKTETTTLSTQGYWRIMTFFAPEKTLQGLQSTLREVTRIKEKGITTSEFKRFQTIIVTGEVLLQDSLLKNVGVTHAHQLRGYSLEEMINRKEKLKAVTQKQVNDALKKYLDVSKLVISGAGPTDKVKKEIESHFALAKKAK